MMDELTPTQHESQSEATVPATIDADRRTIAASVIRTIRASYNPKPLSRPTVDARLSTLTAIPRIAEVCRYSLARLEYSLSAGGGLRSWFKLNLLIAIMIAVPALFVMPVITLVLGTFATWAEFLSATAISIFWATLAITATAALITGALFALRRLNHRRG